MKKLTKLSRAFAGGAAAATLGGCVLVAGLDATFLAEGEDAGGALKDASLGPSDASVADSTTDSPKDSTTEPVPDAPSGDDDASAPADATADSAPPASTALWLLDPTFGDGGVMTIDEPQTTEALGDATWLAATPDTIWMVGAAGDVDGDGNPIGTEIIAVPKSGGANRYHYSAVGPAAGAVTVDSSLYLTTAQILNSDGGIAGDDDDDMNVHLYETSDGVTLSPRSSFVSRDTQISLENLVPVGRAGHMRAVGSSTNGPAFIDLFTDGGAKLVKTNGSYDEVAAGVDVDGGTWLVGGCTLPCDGFPNGAFFVPDDGGVHPLAFDFEPGGASTIAIGADGSLLVGGNGPQSGVFAPIPATDASTVPLAIDPPTLAPDPSSPDGFVAVTSYEVGVSNSLVVISLDHLGAEARGPVSITAFPWPDVITVVGVVGDGTTYLYVELTVDEADGGVRWELVRLVANPAIGH